jgi:hypothetical protein
MDSLLAALKDPRLLPVLMMVLQIGAAVRYGAAGSLGQTIYWVCAFGLTFAVTFLMGTK